MSTSKLNKHFNYSGDPVKEILSPLKNHYNLQSFVYSKKFCDGSEVRLGTHPNWLSVYFDNELYRYNILELEPENYVAGHIFWSQISTHTPILDAVKDFKIANGLTIIKPQQDSCEFYYLGGRVGDRQFGQVLMNNLDLMDQFFNYFKYQARNLINQISKEKMMTFNIAQKNHYSEKDIPCYQNTAIRKKFLNEISQQGIVVDSGKKMVQLTKRELAVSRELLNGKTMLEISETLFISPRTVETHLNHLKTKLDVNKRSELIRVLKTIA